MEFMEDVTKTPAIWKIHCPWCLAKGIYDPELCMGSRDLWVQVGDQINMTCGKCKEFFTIDVVRLEFPKDWKR